MTDRIDHAAKAAEQEEAAWEKSDGFFVIASEVRRQVVLASAQVHATLALVEQQRIANLTALAVQPGDASTQASLGLVVNSSPDSYDSDWKLRPEIAEALGLS